MVLSNAALVLLLSLAVAAVAFCSLCVQASIMAAAVVG